MATKEHRMRARALVGMRTEIDEILEKVVELKGDFPDLSSLDDVKAAILATAGQADTMLGGKRADPDDEDERPIVNGRPRLSKRKPKLPPKPKPSAKPKRGERNVADYGIARSWATGRPVLEMLAAAPNGVTVQEVADKFDLEYGAARWRLVVRKRKGHVRVTDEATSTYEITPAGRAALAKDEDNQDVSAR